MDCQLCNITEISENQRIATTRRSRPIHSCAVLHVRYGHSLSALTFAVVCEHLISSLSHLNKMSHVAQRWALLSVCDLVMVSIAVYSSTYFGHWQYEQ